MNANLHLKNATHLIHPWRDNDFLPWVDTEILFLGNVSMEPIAWNKRNLIAINAILLLQNYTNLIHPWRDSVSLSWIGDGANYTKRKQFRCKECHFVFSNKISLIHTWRDNATYLAHGRQRITPFRQCIHGANRMKLKKSLQLMPFYICKITQIDTPMKRQRFLVLDWHRFILFSCPGSSIPTL